MNTIKRVRDCKTIQDFLKLKYVNPSYGGETNQRYQEDRRDDDYDDSFKAWFKCQVTNKLYWLTVIDVFVSVSDQGTSAEEFHIEINVSNKSIWKVMDYSKYHIHSILGSCISPFNGDKPTEYMNVNCAYDCDLRVFDNYELEFPVEGDEPL